jgi:hypothetical protein
MKIMHGMRTSSFSYQPAGGSMDRGDEQQANTPSYGTSGRITSFPWEGQYLGATEPDRSSHERRVPDSCEIERFLTSLMYGE